MPKAEQSGPSYPRTLLAIAPAFAAKAIIGDMPKGAIEHAIEARLGRKATPLLRGLRQGFQGRGAGRALGACMGVLTAPLYLRGVQLAGSSNKRERNQGLALIGGTAATLALQKGLSEEVMAARAAGQSLSSGAAAGLRLGGAKLVYKLPMALMYWSAMANSRKGSSKTDSASSALLGGAVAGAAGRAIESAITRGGSAVRRGGARGLAKTVGRAAAGGAVGGAFGGLVLSGVIDAAEKAMGKTKHANPLLELAGIPAINTVTKALLRAGEPGRVLGSHLRGGARQTWMDGAKARQLAVGIKEGLHGEANIGYRSAFGYGFTMPELRLNREAGMRIGSALRHVPEGQREMVLRRISTEVSSRPRLLIAPDGAPTPVLADIRQGVAKALGDEDLYTPKTRIGKALAPAYTTAMFGGRGVTQKGLPRGWHPKKVRTRFENMGPDLISATTGIALAASGVPGGFLLGAHGLIGGVKGMAATAPAAKRAGKALMQEAIRDTVIPGLAKTKSRAARDLFLDFAVSPASRSGAQLAGAVAAEGKHVLLSQRLPKKVQTKIFNKLTGRPNAEFGAKLIAGASAPALAVLAKQRLTEGR